MNESLEACATSQLVKQLHQEVSDSQWGTATELFASLGQGHEPVAVMLTCSELGGIPDQVARAQEGEVLVVQDLAGVVPARGTGDAGHAVASIAYALQLPAVRHLIVCGHRHCRVLSELLSDRRPELFLECRASLAEIRAGLRTASATLSDRSLRDLAVQQTVLQQLRHLKTYPAISRRIDSGEVLIHGWLYDEATAIALQFDPRTGRFCRTPGIAD